jgi:peptidoglycan hydrolase CwlO-like protein
MGATAFVLIAAVFLLYPSAVFADTPDSSKRSDIEAQIASLEAEADAIDASLQTVQGQKRSLDTDVKQLDLEIKRREVEIRRLNLAIQKAAADVRGKVQHIGVLSDKISRGRRALAGGLLLIAAYDDENAMTILLKHRSVTDFFTALYGLKKAEAGVQDSLTIFRDDRTELERQKTELQDFQEEQQNLKGLQEMERRFIAQKKQEKDELLRLTRGKEAVFQQLLKSKKQDIAALKTQLFYLEKTGISAQDAVTIADAAARRAGIRTSFLLALLEVETGKQFEDGVISVGTNLGTGNWQRDLYQCYINLGKRNAAESEKRAFMGITSSLGLDPDKMPVSRKPSYGCGGAMGPAQFLPTTWLRFSDRVAELTGHNPPNPWDTSDAFTAAAIFLADAGADQQTTAGETMAAKTYISGQPNCSKYVCRSYASRILALARDIDRTL